jgi:hypothetical protein
MSVILIISIGFVLGLLWFFIDLLVISKYRPIENEDGSNWGEIHNDLDCDKTVCDEKCQGCSVIEFGKKPIKNNEQKDILKELQEVIYIMIENDRLSLNDKELYEQFPEISTSTIHTYVIYTLLERINSRLNDIEYKLN